MRFAAGTAVANYNSGGIDRDGYTFVDRRGIRVEGCLNASDVVECVLTRQGSFDCTVLWETVNSHQIAFRHRNFQWVTVVVRVDWGNATR